MNTQKLYKAAWKSYKHFHLRLRGTLPTYPITQRDLEYYIAYMSHKGRSVETVRVHLSAISHKLKIRGFGAFHVYSHRILQLLKGMRRQNKRQKRKAFSLKDLKTLYRVLPKTMGTTYNVQLLKCMLSVAFFALLRVSEYTVSHTAPQHVLQFRDVYMSCDRSYISLTIKSSKTDQLAKGINLYLGRAATTHKCLCPVRNMRQYIKLRGSMPGPLFVWQTGKAVSATCFGRILRKLLAEGGLQVNRYSPHSLRSGGCTVLARFMPIWKLKAVGRWNSMCVERYIRIPRNPLKITTLTHYDIYIHELYWNSCIYTL